MTAFTICLAVLSILILAYVLGEKWLKAQSWSAPFFAWIEPVEIALWRKSVSILWARFLQVMGFMLTLLASLGQFDLTPLMPFLPNRLQWLPSALPLIVSIAGAIQEKLRKESTKPLALVEVPSDAPPNVLAAVAVAEASKDKAVAVVEASTASGK